MYSDIVDCIKKPCEVGRTGYNAFILWMGGILGSDRLAYPTASEVEAGLKMVFQGHELVP